MRHQISRHKIIQYLKFLILISHIDFLIFWLPDVIHKSYCTPDEAMDPTFQLNMSQPSIVFVAGDIIQMELWRKYLLVPTILIVLVLFSRRATGRHGLGGLMEFICTVPLEVRRTQIVY